MKLLSLFILFVSFQAQAKLEDLQINFRGGMITGSYDDPRANTADPAALAGTEFSVVPSFDVELETFETIRSSYYGRISIAQDLSTSVMNYSYFGLGMRTYFSGIGLPISASGDKTVIKISPKNRMYYGLDVGLSRVEVVRVGILSAPSTGIDFGGHAGNIYQLTDSIGFDAQFGMSYAMGLTNISTSGINIKFLFGVSYTM